MSARASLATAMALICMAGGSALAEPQTGGVKINGRVENHTVVGPSTNIASGFGSRAVSSVGSIGGTSRSAATSTCRCRPARS
jgi:hypothetical protein